MLACSRSYAGHLSFAKERYKASFHLAMSGFLPNYIQILLGLLRGFNLLLGLQMVVLLLLLLLLELKQLTVTSFPPFVFVVLLLGWDGSCMLNYRLLSSGGRISSFEDD